MEYIRIGNIVNTFGIKGELKVQSQTDFVKQRFKAGNTLYILKDNKYVEMVVNTHRVHKGFVLVQFKDYEDINLVEKFKECDLFVSKESVHRLQKGQYYFFDLVGCEVYSEETLIGKVSEVLQGHQPVLRINANGKDVLVPFVESFIKDVDIKEKKIVVNLIEGML